MMAVRESTIAAPVAVKRNHYSVTPEVNGYLDSPKEFSEAFDDYQNNPALANTDPGDGTKFRGRGFKQLTGKYNYSEYWKYRGWLQQSDYDPVWFKTRRPGPIIPNPEVVANDAYSCVDTAGFYCARYRVGKPADGGIAREASAAVTKRVNPNDRRSVSPRWEETRLAYQILGDDS
ncbi:hypothetical protein QTN24_23900 [Cupriavidus sp. SZY C1]|uniref:hypothetical protein n=1 Tax=Cupriavidus sp. SZY C1 TaxID=3055037 RepID=UPI0028B33422|nr:hypothetical protein [Cupriavidus sp. SZY C1]MDT6964563.1 hypothetical protein [Cupriavidus sp. SZY C1]